MYFLQWSVALKSAWLENYDGKFMFEKAKCKQIYMLLFFE